MGKAGWIQISRFFLIDTDRICIESIEPRRQEGKKSDKKLSEKYKGISGKV